MAAVFQVRPVGADPTTYTVGAGRSLDASFSSEDIEVHGPNGFYRQFKGAAPLQVSAAYDERRLQLSLTFRNSGRERVRLAVQDGYTGRTTRLTLDGRDRVTRDWTLRHAGGWYDLLVTLVGDDDFAARFARHVENGEDSISDPLMGGPG